MNSQEDIDNRMRELYTTGVPVPFECQLACRVKKGDCGKIEKALHTAFAPQRINTNRKFFRIQVEQAKARLELFHHIDITEDVAAEIDNDLTEEDRVATKKAQVHRPALNFFQMSLRKGDVLNWKENPDVTTAVYTDRTVIHYGKEMAIIAVTQDLKGSMWYVAPGAYWTHKDRLLSEIYDETYPVEE